MSTAEKPEWPWITVVAIDLITPTTEPPVAATTTRTTDGAIPLAVRQPPCF
jgi:hypothetical protein